jgi:hypothetical protein
MSAALLYDPYAFPLHTTFLSRCWVTTHTDRKRLLRPGGLVIPALAELRIAAVDDRDYLAATKQQWENVAGFDLTSAMTQVKQEWDIAWTAGCMPDSSWLLIICH